MTKAHNTVFRRQSNIVLMNSSSVARFQGFTRFNASELDNFLILASNPLIEVSKTYHHPEGKSSVGERA